MLRAYIGLGSNLGDKRTMIETALAALDATEGVRVAARSGDFRTPPWGDPDQDWFVNACAALDTRLPPHDLLNACLAVEEGLGRQRARKWGPRLIDVDILDYDGRSLDTPELILPHPFLLERAFVLAPLAEIAPHLHIGDTTVLEALAKLETSGIERLED